MNTRPAHKHYEIHVKRVLQNNIKSQGMLFHNQILRRFIDKIINFRQSGEIVSVSFNPEIIFVFAYREFHIWVFHMFMGYDSETDIEVDIYKTLTLGFQIESSNCYNEDTHIVKKLTNIWQILWKYLMKRNSWLWAPFEHELCGIKFCHTDFSIFLTLSWPFGVSKLLFAFRCAQDKSLLHSIICSKLLSWSV